MLPLVVDGLTGLAIFSFSVAGAFSLLHAWLSTSFSLHSLCTLHLSWWLTISNLKLPFPSTKEVRISWISCDHFLQYIQNIIFCFSSYLSQENCSNQFCRNLPPFRFWVLGNEALLVATVEDVVATLTGFEVWITLSNLEWSSDGYGAMKRSLLWSVIIGPDGTIVIFDERRYCCKDEIRGWLGHSCFWVKFVLEPEAFNQSVESLVVGGGLFQSDCWFITLQVFCHSPRLILQTFSFHSQVTDVRRFLLTESPQSDFVWEQRR